MCQIAHHIYHVAIFRPYKFLRVLVAHNIQSPTKNFAFTLYVPHLDLPKMHAGTARLCLFHQCKCLPCHIEQGNVILNVALCQNLHIIVSQIFDSINLSNFPPLLLLGFKFCQTCMLQDFLLSCLQFTSCVHIYTCSAGCHWLWSIITCNIQYQHNVAASTVEPVYMPVVAFGPKIFVLMVLVAVPRLPQLTTNVLTTKAGSTVHMHVIIAALVVQQWLL